MLFPSSRRAMIDNTLLSFVDSPLWRVRNIPLLECIIVVLATVTIMFDGDHLYHIKFKVHIYDLLRVEVFWISLIEPIGI